MFTSPIRHLLHGAIAALVAISLTTACQSMDAKKADANVNLLRIGCSAVPHEQILKHLAPRLAERGITLRTVVMQDYVQPNLRVESGDLHANFFQTAAYFEDFAQHNDVHLASAGSVHVEPFALYSKKSRLDNLPEGARVAVPADASNQHRALMLLARAGLITLPEGGGRLFGTRDIVANPKKLKFSQVEAAMVPRLLADVDLAGINANFALDAGLRPARDGLVVESAADGPYANIVAVRQRDTTHPAIVALMEELRSDATRTFIAEHYEGAILPIF